MELRLAAKAPSLELPLQLLLQTLHQLLSLWLALGLALDHLEQSRGDASHGSLAMCLPAGRLHRSQGLALTQALTQALLLAAQRQERLLGGLLGDLETIPEGSVRIPNLAQEISVAAPAAASSQVLGQVLDLHDRGAEIDLCLGVASRRVAGRSSSHLDLLESPSWLDLASDFP